MYVYCLTCEFKFKKKYVRLFRTPFEILKLFYFHALRFSISSFNFLIASFFFGEQHSSKEKDIKTINFKEKRNSCVYICGPICFRKWISFLCRILNWRENVVIRKWNHNKRKSLALASLEVWTFLHFYNWW